jgi:hypothetical protein
VTQVAKKAKTSRGRVTHVIKCSQNANIILDLRTIFAICELIRYNVIMKAGNQLKPQDVLVLIKILTAYKNDSWRYSDLAKDLGMSQSEVHSAIKRAELAKLYDPLTKRPIRSHLGEYLISGVRFAFPAIPGKEAVGIPTAHSAPPLNKTIVSEKGDVYVWPSRSGKIKGLSIEPLYRAVPNACAKDRELHIFFALVDALRVGRAREVDLAKKLLQEKLATS